MRRELPTLPPEIIFDILSRLPVKPLCRFKSVSKPWLSIITDPHFIRAHFQRSNKSQKLIIASPKFPSSVYSLNCQSPNDPIEQIHTFCNFPFEILSSCYGILLLGYRDIPFALWNPSTRRHQIIASLCHSKGVAIHGLGYDSARDDFKVITAIRPIEGPTHVYVFSSRSNSWKRIRDLDYRIIISGPVLNGVPHWVGMYDEGTGFSISCTIITVIVHFDPYEETFKELPLPIHSCLYPQLTVLCGNLCVVENHDDALDVRVMKESWSELFVVPHSIYGHFLKPLFKGGGHEVYFCCIMPLYFQEENGEVLILVNSEALVMYNLKDNRVKTIEIPQYGKSLNVACYVESLVSPNGGFGTTSDR